MSLTEDEMLDRVAVQQVLAVLSEPDRIMMKMVFGLEYPADWGNRQPTFTTIGHYIGMRFEGEPLSEAAIRYRRDVLLRRLRGEREGLRRPKRGRKR